MWVYSLKIEKLQLVLMTMPGVLRANLTYIYIGISIIRMGKTRSIRVGLHLLCAFYNNTVQKLVMILIQGGRQIS